MLAQVKFAAGAAVEKAYVVWELLKRFLADQQLRRTAVAGDLPIAILKILTTVAAKQLIDVYHQPDGQRKQLKVALSRFEEQREILEEQRREIEESLDAMRLTTNFVSDCLSKLGGAD